MLNREFPVPTALDTHPKHDIALGALRIGHSETDITAPAAGVAADHPAPDTPVPAAVDLSWRLQDEQSTVPASAAEASPPPAPAPPASPPPAESNTADAPRPPSQRIDDHAPPSGGLVRVLAVVLAAVALGVGVGVFIALRDRDGSVAGPPVESASPSSPPVSPSAPSPTPSTPTPSPRPDPSASLPASAPLGDQVIVWPRVRDGNFDVALLDLDSGEETRLTTGPTDDSGPVITRNRRTIMYTRVVNDKPTLRVMAANGDGDRLLFPKPPEDCFQLSRPAAAPDGQLVVTCNTEDEPLQARLLVITLEGRIVRELDEGRMGDPTVSPDGKSVLYWRNTDGDRSGGALYRIPLNGSGSRVQLTEGGDGVDTDPVVSPDGRQLAFSRRTGSQRAVMTAPFDGKALTGDPRQRTEEENAQDPSWSPDGLQIAYKSGPNDDADLYVLDLVSGDSRQVVDNPEQDTGPAWTTR
jgi:dipeptidyl aminopeptidase/acylaminoacyl peptidase